MSSELIAKEPDALQGLLTGMKAGLDSSPGIKGIRDQRARDREAVVANVLNQMRALMKSQVVSTHVRSPRRHRATSRRRRAVPLPSTPPSPIGFLTRAFAVMPIHRWCRGAYSWSALSTRSRLVSSTSSSSSCQNPPRRVRRARCVREPRMLATRLTSVVRVCGDMAYEGHSRNPQVQVQYMRELDNCVGTVRESGKQVRGVRAKARVGSASASIVRVHAGMKAAVL